MDSITKVTVWNKARDQIKTVEYLRGDFFSGLTPAKQDNFRAKHAHESNDYVSVCVLPEIFFEEIINEDFTKEVSK